MQKYNKSSLSRYTIMAIAATIFVASLFIPCIFPSLKEGLEDPKKTKNPEEPEKLEISIYDKFFLDAIMDDISLNDPTTNSPFSVELLQWVGVGDSAINNALSNLDLSITDKIKAVKKRMSSTSLVAEV
jgi:hypothetical protein